MRLGNLLQLAIIIVLLLPLFGVSPAALLSDGYDAARERLRGALDEAGRDNRFSGTATALAGLLDPSPRAMELSWRNIEKHMRTAENGYRLVRLTTDNDFVRNLAAQPGEQIEKAIDAVKAGVTDLSLENMERAFDNPVPKLPKSWH